MFMRYSAPYDITSAIAVLVQPRCLAMITGAHVLLYSKDPDADRAFFRDVLQLRSVDAGGGWLIFALPPAEVAVHPSHGEVGPRPGGDRPDGAADELVWGGLGGAAERGGVAEVEGDA